MKSVKTKTYKLKVDEKLLHEQILALEKSNTDELYKVGLLNMLDDIYDQESDKEGNINLWAFNEI